MGRFLIRARREGLARLVFPFKYERSWSRFTGLGLETCDGPEVRVFGYSHVKFGLGKALSLVESI